MKIEFLYYTTLVILFAGQIINVYGSFITANTPNNTLWSTYLATLPFMLIQKLLTTFGIYLIDSYNYVTTNNIVLTLLIFQFIATLIISYLYLHIQVYISDYIGCVLFALGYYISTYHAYTKFINHPNPHQYPYKK